MHLYQQSNNNRKKSLESLTSLYLISNNYQPSWHLVYQELCHSDKQSTGSYFWKLFWKCQPISLLKIFLLQQGLHQLKNLMKGYHQPVFLGLMDLQKKSLFQVKARLGQARLVQARLGMLGWLVLLDLEQFSKKNTNFQELSFKYRKDSYSF